MGQLQLTYDSHADEALHYAHRVLAGEIPACKWVKAACRRQLDDLERWRTDPDYPFDWQPEKVNRVITFIQLLRHVKGRWGGLQLVLEAWQKFVIACAFGWVKKADGLRRFRTIYLEVPRKNAKTTLLAGIGLFMLNADGEWGAEVYAAATTRDQAKIVFDVAQQMARMDGEFRAKFGVEVLTHSMLVKDTASKMVPLSAEGSTLDGLNVSCALIDELHAHKTRAVHDVIDSATGARDQPLICKITTAGSNRAGICYDQRAYLTKILNRTLRQAGGLGYKVTGDSAEDDAYWGIIYTLDEGDDEFDEATWAKANPNYGISVDPADMRRMATVAKVQAAARSEFLTKRLNVWINADAAWLNMLQWDAAADPVLSETDFAGQPCTIGLDAAFKKDLFAKVKVFRRDLADGPHYYAFGRYYLPEAQAQGEGKEQMAAWVRDGWVRTTPGEVLDIQAVREELIGDDDTGQQGDIHRYQVREVPFDPAMITQFATEMLEEGVPMVEIPARAQNFSPAMKELEELLAAGRFHHTGDPVLAWMMSNVSLNKRWLNAGILCPTKERADSKIDGAIALFLALGRAMVPATVEPEFFVL